jgi:hypothetical protein
VHTTATAWRVAVFENRQPVTAAELMNRSSLFILMLGVFRQLGLKPNSEQKVETHFEKYKTALDELLERLKNLSKIIINKTF